MELKKYLFRRDFFWKVKENLFWFIRNNSRNSFKDHIILLKNLERGDIVDVGVSLDKIVQLYCKYFSLLLKGQYYKSWIFYIKKGF